MGSSESKIEQLRTSLLLLFSKEVILKFTSTLESPGVSQISCCPEHITNQLNLHLWGWKPGFWTSLNFPMILIWIQV